MEWEKKDTAMKHMPLSYNLNQNSLTYNYRLLIKLSVSDLNNQEVELIYMGLKNSDVIYLIIL